MMKHTQAKENKKTRKSYKVPTDSEGKVAMEKWRKGTTKKRRTSVAPTYSVSHEELKMQRWKETQTAIQHISYVTPGKYRSMVFAAGGLGKTEVGHETEYINIEGDRSSDEGLLKLKREKKATSPLI